MADNDPRDSSSYFPGCRKDANCECEMCLDSINATLDLMPLSVQRSSLTKLSLTPPSASVETTPIFLGTTAISTPRSVSCSVTKPPGPQLTSRKDIIDREEERKGKTDKTPASARSTFVVLTVGLVLCFIFTAAELGFRLAFSGILGTQFTDEKVNNSTRKSLVVKDLNERLRFIQEQLKFSVADGKISDCSQSDSMWKVSREGTLLISRCVLYKSAMEEVTIWGWPLQTSGLFEIGFSSSSITVLTGRVIQWPNGRFGFSIQTANSSWVQPEWSASVLQLDPNTWVTEYRRSSFLQSPGFIGASIRILWHRFSHSEKWNGANFPTIQEFYSHYRTKKQELVPT